MSTDPIDADLTGSVDGRIAKERLYHWLLFGCAALTVLVTGSIIVTLTVDAIAFFEQVDAVSFFTGTEWESSRDSFGVLPLVTATLIVTVISAMVAIPIGTAAAVYLSEYASDRARSLLKPALEILAGIPTVVYGYLALVYLTPWLRAAGLELNLFNLLSASIMVGIMIIPMVSSISEDAMSAVPDSLREAGYGLGATKFEVSTGIVIPAAVSGIFSSYILALSRAIGETMIVVMAGGMQARMLDMTNPLANLFNSGQTMTAAMVHAVTSDATGGTPEFYSMFAIGLTLFVITFAMNLLSNRIAARYREEYQ
ncbi:phosphate ABC transporter permease subunit PstC [Natronococcus sp. JC468]|uniref:phosphate ABC transporter permease subunit PstC n=1 Tax=Natronococcus sp. JC468 TaxID=1961921 RepID=UPI00143C58DF|nr:phosphate ABC transporter permease subunit PstC [Natronococcus sp. JC468]NKE38078.1 phosphate ABC transporter permease subunit PstC [Natronococcus sp. JC468]